MTNDELIDEITEEIKEKSFTQGYWPIRYLQALRAVVELHKPNKIPDWVPTEEENICWCAHIYPCPTIQAIEDMLHG